MWTIYSYLSFSFFSQKSKKKRHHTVSFNFSFDVFSVSPHSACISLVIINVVTLPHLQPPPMSSESEGEIKSSRKRKHEEGHSSAKIKKHKVLYRFVGPCIHVCHM